MLIDLLRISHGAHGYHGLTAAICAIFVNCGGKCRRPRTANSERTALLAVGLGFGRLEQNESSLRLIVVRIRRVLAGIVTLQGRCDIAWGLELDASRVLWRLQRGRLERFDLALIRGHRRALAVTFGYAWSARVVILKLVVTLVFDHSVDFEPFVEGFIHDLSICTCCSVLLRRSGRNWSDDRCGLSAERQIDLTQELCGAS